MAVGDDEAKVRAERARAIGLFRYQLIREAADPAHSTKQRGKLVRELASREHTDPFGRRVRISRQTIDRWIRDWRAGGFDALVPNPRQCTPRTPAEVLELAVALRRENPERTAAQIRRILRTQLGWAPDERTLQRHFDRLGLTGAAAGSAPAVFGRFEAEHPNDLWTGDALHGHELAAARRICSRSSMIIPGCCPATGGAMPRTPCGWPPRCARRWPPAVSPTPSMSTTARRSSTRGCCGRARNSVCAWFIPHHAGPKAGAKSRGSSGPCASSSWSRSPANPTSSAATTSTDLAELNRLFAAWVETVYHRTVHSETGQTPLARWSAAGPVALPAPGGAGRGVPVGGAPPRDQDRHRVAARQQLRGRPGAGRAARSSWCSTRST